MRTLVAASTFALLALCASADDKSTQRIGFFLDSAVPHVAAGGTQWQTTFLFHNPSSQTEKFYLNFLQDNGQPLAIPIRGGLSTQVLVTLPPHTTTKLTTDYRPDLPTLSGSALISDPYDCADCRFYYSTVHTIFALYDWQQRKFLCEATVPQESPYENNVILVYDQENGYVTSLALMNPSTYEIKRVTVSIYDKNNALLRTDQFYMDPKTHQAFELCTRYPETAGKMGYVKFQTDGIGGVAGIGLRFSPNATFTSMHFLSADLVD